jgi:hypothetical protein
MNGFFRQINIPEAPALRQFYRVRTDVPAPSP